MRLEGKVAIVTGGASGIGKIYSRRLATEGAKVVLADIDESAVKATEQDYRAKGLDVLGVQTDVSDEASVEHMVQRTIAQYGHIDVLLNNAGLMVQLPNFPVETMSVDVWDRAMAVNVRGPFLCAREVLPHMQAQRSGSIINISSSTIINGGSSGGGVVHYVSSKAAVWGFTRALSREVGEYNIRVNSIAPGATVSETVAAAYGEGAFERVVSMRSMKRQQSPEDLVGTAVFLASDESGFMTGQMLTVDGGKDLY